jgi:hypothetical protein
MCHAPGAAEGLPRHIDALLVDREFLRELVDELEGDASAIAQAGYHWRLAVGGGGRAVADPPTVGLRNDHVTRKLLLVFRESPDARPEDVPQPHLLLVIRAEAPAAVEVHHERELSRCVRPEETIGHRPVVLVRPGLELLRDLLGCAPERVNERLPFR